MVKFITTLLVMLPVFIFASPKDSTKTTQKFSIGVEFAPSIAYRSNSAIGKGKDNQFLVNYSLPLLDSIEDKKLAYAVGIKLAYQLSKRFTIKTGAFYSNKGYINKEIIITNSNGNQISSTNNSKSNIIYNYNYIDIPVNTNFYILTNKIKLFVSAGVINNIFIHQQIIINEGNGKKEIFKTKKGYTNYNISFLGGLGAEYHFSNKFYLLLEPQYQRMINSILKSFLSDNQYKTVLYNYALNVGIYYKF